MDKVSGRLTVFFEEPFWVGVFERISEGKLSICKVTFGAEPKDYEIYDFVLKNYYHHFDIYRHNRLADYDINFCKGCRTCHTTAKCVQKDDVDRIIEQFEWADIIISVSPSYWADLPGQFKAFIDRCAPWCNTHEPHAKISSGKKGYAIALRTGPSMRECERIIKSIEHFYGHMEMECCDWLGLCWWNIRKIWNVKKMSLWNFVARLIK